MDRSLLMRVTKRMHHAAVLTLLFSFTFAPITPVLAQDAGNSASPSAAAQSSAGEAPGDTTTAPAPLDTTPPAVEPETTPPPTDEPPPEEEPKEEAPPEEDALMGAALSATEPQSGNLVSSDGHSSGAN